MGRGVLESAALRASTYAASCFCAAAHGVRRRYGTGLTYGTRVLHTRDMNTTQAASHILAIAAELETLPALPVIYARDMYAAQGVRLTAEDRAALKARADFNRKWGLPDTGITLRVLSPSGAHIGGMTYRNF